MAERNQTELSRDFDPGSDAHPVSNGIQSDRIDNNRETDDTSGDGDPRRTANRGFAAMDPEKQKRIASEGGRAAHRQGVAHEWSRDEAREAGKKGGQIVSRNREHMSEIGRKGGQSSGQRRQRTSEADQPAQ